MSVRLGVGIGCDSVRAVLVRRGGVAWSASAPLGEGETLRDVLARVLAAAPRRRWERVRLAAAVGPSAAQVKRLAGLPPVKNRRLLAELVSENAGRFFLQNGVPLRVTDVHVAGPGEIWGGAIEAPVIEEIAAAARQLGICFEGAHPSVAVLPYALAAADGVVLWRDGGTCADVTIQGRALVRARRLPAAAPGGAAPAAGAPPPVHPALHALGETGWEFADAYGAAVAPARAPLALAPTPRRASGAAGGMWLGAAALLVLASAGAALVAPALAASRAAARAAARSDELRVARQEVARTEAALAHLSATLGQAAAFGAERRSMLGLLGALAAATPESTAIVTLRVDGGAGSFVVLAPRAAAVLSTLDEVDEIAGATIASPVTRELLGAQELERVTIKFRRIRPTSAPTSAATRPRAPPGGEERP